MLRISVAYKVRESSSTCFPLSSLDVAVMRDLLEEKLLGYKPEAEVREPFMCCMQRYIKESSLILCSYFSMELKVGELQRLNDNYKGFAESCKKLSSESECARSSIVKRNFRITELERKVNKVEQKHYVLLL